MRRDLDLRGTIAVLTHSRTGSSLLMQTLRLLGKTVHGEEAPATLDHALNPRGFFEDPELLEHGLQAAALRDRPGLLANRAVKIALAPMVERAIEEDWRAIEERAVVMLPIRHPAEALASRNAFLAADTPSSARLAWFREAVHRYFVDYGCLASRWGRLDRDAPCVCIDYRMAIDDPAAYVARVAGAAGLSPAAVQTAAAIENITRDLYRHRAGVQPGGGEAAGLRALEPIYEVLRADDTSKWSRLRDTLPAWALAAGG